MSGVAAGVARIGDIGRLVRFSHSIFALPFALQGAWLAGRGAPSWRTLAGIVAACVFARTAAMGFNRLIDARIDAMNPRTRTREIPSGRLSRASVALLVAACSLAFLAVAFALSPLCGWLAPGVLAVLFFYSWTKRFTALCHLVLGLSLALAPLGAWLAVRETLGSGLEVPLVLAASVMTWVAGFDVIYACQDAQFDREAHLHSIPARWGVSRALQVARALHVLTLLLWIALAWRAQLGWIYALAVAGAAVLLSMQHRVVRADDLRRVDLAFFTLNGWVGVGLFAGLLLDLRFAH